jgi:putative acetyltransferase
MPSDLPVQELRHASRRMVQQLGLLANGPGSAGPTLSECHVLTELAGDAPLTITELADRLALDKSTMSRTVGRLRRRDLVKTSRTTADKRAKPIRLTPKGRREVRRIDRLADRQVATALELLAPSDRAAVVNGLELYARALTHARAQRDFTIRPVHRSDNAALARLIRGVMTEYGIVDDVCAGEGSEVDAMYQAYRGDRTVYLVVARGRRALGGGGIGPLQGADASVCELRKMYFLPELRGLGLGRRVLDLLLDRARALGYRQCYLETSDSMVEARQLYERAGFSAQEGPVGKTGYTACNRWYMREL